MSLGSLAAVGSYFDAVREGILSRSMLKAILSD